jgi:hypothetical protein
MSFPIDGIFAGKMNTITKRQLLKKNAQIERAAKIGVEGGRGGRIAHE